MVDPNLTVGELIDAWWKYHYYEGDITVTVPERAAPRQIGTSIRPLVRYE